MDVLRTDDARFDNLPGYSFAPHYVEVDGLRVHYVDEGPRDGKRVLLLHGEPTWSFLYRRMIPPLAGAGYRVLAPDLVGFGRSDKPSARAHYTYLRHVEWMKEVVKKLDLHDVTLFGQDWGGLIGLRLVAEDMPRFARVAVSNTGLPTGEQKLSGAFEAWRDFSQNVPELPISKIIQTGCVRPIAPEVLAAYDAPFPAESFKEGARQFPLLVPARPDDPAAPANRAAWEALARFERPFLTLFSDKDPVTAGADAPMKKLIPGTKGQPHAVIANAGHFVQEDAGEELAEKLLAWMA